MKRSGKKMLIHSWPTYISQADLVILQAFVSQGFFTVCQFITKKVIQPGFSISSGFAFPSNMKYKVLLISFPDEALGRNLQYHSIYNPCTEVLDCILISILLNIFYQNTCKTLRLIRICIQEQNAFMSDRRYCFSFF